MGVKIFAANYVAVTRGLALVADVNHFSAHFRRQCTVTAYNACHDRLAWRSTAAAGPVKAPGTGWVYPVAYDGFVATASGVQRQQRRTQVWPHLTLGGQPEHHRSFSRAARVHPRSTRRANSGSLSAAASAAEVDTSVRHEARKFEGTRSRRGGLIWR